MLIWEEGTAARLAMLPSTVREETANGSKTSQILAKSLNTTGAFGAGCCAATPGARVASLDWACCCWGSVRTSVRFGFACAICSVLAFFLWA